MSRKSGNRLAALAKPAAADEARSAKIMPQQAKAIGTGFQMIESARFLTLIRLEPAGAQHARSRQRCEGANYQRNGPKGRQEEDFHHAGTAARRALGRDGE